VFFYFCGIADPAKIKEHSNWRRIKRSATTNLMKLKKGEKMRTKLWLILTALLVLGLAACAGSDATLGDVTLARSVDKNNQPANPVDSFVPGETVWLAVEFESAYQGLAASVRWYRGDVLLETQTMTASRDVDSLNPLWLSSKLQTAPDWQAGEYRCELFVPDQGTRSLTFQLKK
jgi:hypothetical protein